MSLGRDMAECHLVETGPCRFSWAWSHVRIPFDGCWKGLVIGQLLYESVAKVTVYALFFA